MDTIQCLDKILEIIDLNLGGFKEMGSRGSGNWGHRGRKGKRGGSLPGGGKSTSSGSARLEMTEKISREAGIKNLQEPLTIHQWIQWLKTHADERISNLGHGIEFATQTGRLPNWTTKGFDRYFTREQKIMTNKQMASTLADAALSHGGTTASAVKALQRAMGLTVR